MATTDVGGTWIARCPVCQGSGRVMIFPSLITTAETVGPTAPCPRCNGRGYVRKEG